MHRPLSAFRFADHIRAGDVIGWPQGPGERVALTEALVLQRAELPTGSGRPTPFFGLTSSTTLRPELADRFAFRALNDAGSNRRISALADIIPCHVSAIPSLLRGGQLRLDIALIQVRLLPDGGYTLGVICDFTEAMIDVIVTEYGAAHLRGCSLAERARSLIAIAHPDHRDALLQHKGWQ